MLRQKKTLLQTVLRSRERGRESERPWLACVPHNARFTHTLFAMCMWCVFVSVPMLTAFTLHADAVRRSVPGAVRIQQCRDRLRTEFIFAVLHVLI